MNTTAQSRLAQIKDFLTMNKTASAIPFDPNSTKFPRRKDVPQAKYGPEGVPTAWVWGENDMVGRLNLLTPTRVKAAASSEIKTGDMVPINWSLNHPETPAFARESFEHKIKTLAENIAYDDVYHLNTQSGTQWDGFRHFAWVPTGSFYNNTHGSDIIGEKANDKCSIHHWANHGIAGRGVLLDYRSYCDKKGIAFDSYQAERISYADLEACGKEQGFDIRPQAQGGDIQVGDLLFIRSGFIRTYFSKSQEERKRLALRPHQLGPDDGQRYAGVKQEEPMIDWLHDCYFAAVAGDSPTFEAWPTNQDYHLHEYLLALWGCPLGEMVDLERLSEMCKEKKRWTFFVTSAPANVPGGVGSHVNGTAIF
ncbi:hypothetical protein JMJ35_009178 [Cladonia borealis]|uniref:Cyclase n=1 Tax=Cladonia borealis TaxID=184061 RepID=A0AA39V217_9LECA|nr:hypothetical protein JMJ35_009178 [Cladonia borealis]